MKALIRFTLAILLFVSLTLTAAAQTIDTAILGTITDSSGGVVVNATVTITEDATGAVYVITTNNLGEFIIHSSRDRGGLIRCKGLNARCRKAEQMHIDAAFIHDLKPVGEVDKAPAPFTNGLYESEKLHFTGF